MNQGWCQQGMAEALKIEFFPWPFQASQEACSWSRVVLEKQEKNFFNFSSLKASQAEFSRKGEQSLEMGKGSSSSGLGNRVLCGF